MNFSRTEPQELGLPSLYTMPSAFAVMNYQPKHWKTKKPCWTPVMNSWGMPYENKGNAINLAKQMMDRNTTNVCVIDISNWEVVWSSWEEGGLK
tara:strand:+ start:153 stop:434 length:282 start_codon:yes stop_codon:yes gene_type:complete